TIPQPGAFPNGVGNTSRDCTPGYDAAVYGQIPKQPMQGSETECALPLLDEDVVIFLWGKFRHGLSSPASFRAPAGSRRQLFIFVNYFRAGTVGKIYPMSQIYINNRPSLFPHEVAQALIVQNN